ncbi:AfsR/SARP family transcriptional regulator [Kutzneria chonburiensis]|uniref:BTAD domain-containing putative transcriptional regulator n=1 Tax=Kutzneria chonburiensis TaxID=1483604 RepID=A0ABV6MJM2_9PSEU|nr:BTAD domain-containing putative transcriptional regulator [Kutzneria chonburiensis]
MRFQLLGDIQVTVDGEPVDVGPVRQRSVLAALLVDVNEAVSTDQLVDRVWGDEPPASARGTLASYLTRLRQALPDVTIERVRGGQRLVADPLTVDIVEFRAHIEAGRYGKALELWHDEPLGGLSTPWASRLRAKLADEAFVAVLDLADEHFAGGRYAEALPWLTSVAGDHPLDERLTGQLMRALAAIGRQADALQQYERLRRQLAEELGVDPRPELQDQYQRILHGEMPSQGPVPQQLLSPPRDFVGRTAELARLDETGGVVVVSGAGGIGKTWLALHWAHRDAHRFPDGQLYVNLRGFDPSGRPVSAERVLRGFLEGLGVASSAVPGEVESQAALYRSLLADRRMLVLLDNAADSAQVVPLLPGGSSTVIVTSRDQLTGLITTHGARYLAVDTLPPEAARALLAARIGADRVAAEPDAVTELVERCAGLPLALSIVAGRAQSYPEFPLAALADELREAGLNALDEDDELASLRAALSASADTLKPPEAQLFALLGHVPGLDISKAAADALIDGNARRPLRALERVSLVQQHVPGRYRMHDLIRLYAAEQFMSDRDAALTRLVTYYTHGMYAVDRALFPHRGAPALPLVSEVAHDDPWEWFRAEHACAAAAGRLAAELGLHEHVWQLAWYAAPMRWRASYVQDSLDAWRLAISAAEALDHTAALAQAYRSLGTATAQLSRYDEALPPLRHALELMERSGSELNIAIAHSALAHALHNSRRYREALPHAEQSLAILARLDVTVLAAQARCQVGEILVQLDEHEAGLEYLEQALAVFREHGDTDSEAIVVGDIARALFRGGRAAEALPMYETARDMYASSGIDFHLVWILDELGDVRQAVGDPAGAAECWREAMRRCLLQHRHDQAATIRAKLARSTLSD